MPSEDVKLVKIAALLAAAQTNLTNAAVLFAEYMDDVASPMSRKSQMALPNIRSLQLWAEHLAVNGPTLRQDIWDATGLNLSQSGHTQVKQWKGPMAFWPENSVSPGSVCSIPSLGNGKGRPPVIYFLWSQRFDVRPKFGVGPERSSDSDALLGVIQPEPEYQIGETISQEDAPTVSEADSFCVAPWPTDLGAQYAERMFEPIQLTPENEVKVADLLKQNIPIQTVPWEEQHATILSLAAQGVKPTPEQFTLLRSTHPDGPDGANLAVAMAGKGTQQEIS